MSILQGHHRHTTLLKRSYTTTMPGNNNIFNSLLKVKFPFYKQHDQMDCGPTCLRMITKYYGKHFSLNTLRAFCAKDREGVSVLSLCEAAENLGFRTLAIKIPSSRLGEIPLPAIIHWQQNHFVVVYQITKQFVLVADPAFGSVKYTHEEFAQQFGQAGAASDSQGIIIALEPCAQFYRQLSEDESTSVNLGTLFTYLKHYKKLMVQLVIGLALGTLFSLIFPFLTQSVVDIGIGTLDIDFVYTIVIAQLMLFIGKTSVEFIRGWIILHVGARVNMALISDFLIKLFKLPIAFFDARNIGDIMQRIQDNTRIEDFLSSTSLEIIFSMLNLVIFGVILLYYNQLIFLVFFIGSLASIIWILMYTKKRRELDFKRFKQLSMEQNHLIQIVNGMHEIKLSGAQTQTRWHWEKIQIALFKTRAHAMALTQYQQAGALFINELKNIIIVFLAAKSVIDGSMTLGMMMAVQYIVGQLNAPITQFIDFSRIYQDAIIAMERLSEIQTKQEEEQQQPSVAPSLGHQPLIIKDVYFSYNSSVEKPTLENVCLSIPQGKVTAIVGGSGSGKTTLLHLLLKFYTPDQGKIMIGPTNLANLSAQLWRQKCGAVLQDGYIFSDSIAANIALGDYQIDSTKLLNAVKIANLEDYIDSLPLGYNTVIGNDGVGMSGGQRQRILIARAIYKNPSYLFFDEATSSLDASNEYIIMNNLHKFFQGKTVIIIAHRLSTVKNADQIIVMKSGLIIESGSHDELVRKKEDYYLLIKNQLELGT